MRISLVLSVAIVVALASPVLAQRNVDTADTIVTNGKILTVDADFRVVEALAIDNGRIVARGTRAEVGRSVVMRRFHARGRGRSSRIEKWFSHLKIVVAERAQVEGQEAA